MAVARASVARALFTTPINAPAKVNLYLHVTGRRDDGYHLLDSLAVFTALGDSVSVSSAPAGEGMQLAVHGPFADQTGSCDDNLVMRAATLLNATYPSSSLSSSRPSRDVTIDLTKRLPVAAGIGGGSSDAAATLMALSRYWQLDVSQRDLMDLGAGLGADVPMCLYREPVLAGGIGETLSPLCGLPQFSLVLANPGVPLSTRDVFNAFAIPAVPPPPPLKAPPDSVQSLVTALRERRNDLTDAALGLVPEIAVVLDSLGAQPDCLLARMSGSGATCFGLFADSRRASAARDTIRDSHPRWWVESTALL